MAWNGDDLIVHDASQAVAHVAWTLAQVFGIEEKQVHVTSPFVGGGFGSKTLWQHQILAAAASKLAGRPVRIVLSREGVYRIVGGRTLDRAARRDRRAGRRPLRRADPHRRGRDDRAQQLPEPFILPARSAYAAGSFKLDVEAVELDMVANTFMRAPGESVGTFALECAVDELAVQLGIDPDRAAHPQRAAKRTRPRGTPFSSRHIVEAYRAGAERFGWDAAQRRRRARSAKANGWSAWAARPRPIPITACPAARRASR